MEAEFHNNHTDNICEKHVLLTEMRWNVFWTSLYYTCYTLYTCFLYSGIYD